MQNTWDCFNKGIPACYRKYTKQHIQSHEYLKHKCPGCQLYDFCIADKYTYPCDECKCEGCRHLIGERQ